MQCLLKYKWVKLPRDRIPETDGILGSYLRLTARAAICPGRVRYCQYENAVTAGMWAGGIVGLKSILGIKKADQALLTLKVLAELGLITYEYKPANKYIWYKITDYIAAEGMTVKNENSVYVYDAGSFIKDQTGDYDSIGRLSRMNADLFYLACSYGYIANPQEYEIKEMTPREQYYRFADGRDNGLSEIQSDSDEAFKDWLENHRNFGGHPFEVMAGGNSTHVSLYVHHDDPGYFFILEGSSLGRTVETLNFYIALREHNLPVFLVNKDLLIQRLHETEQIGIVPEDIIPKYCENMFPGNSVHDFMWLPWEEPERSLVAEKCTWLPEQKVELLKKGR